MNSPLAKLVSWQLSTGQLDHWTSYHIAAGAFLCKIFQWLHWSDFWCVMGVFIVGVLWEIFEWIIEDHPTYVAAADVKKKKKKGKKISGKGKKKKKGFFSKVFGSK